MYVVLVTHLSGHGEVTSPILLTTDPVKAVNTSRLAREGDGFRFDRECCIAVAKMVPEAIYIEYRDGILPDGASTEYVLIERPKFSEVGGSAFAGGRPGSTLSHWDEEWVDASFKQIYEDAAQAREAAARR